MLYITVLLAILGTITAAPQYYLTTGNTKLINQFGNQNYKQCPVGLILDALNRCVQPVIERYYYVFDSPKLSSSQQDLYVFEGNSKQLPGSQQSSQAYGNNKATSASPYFFLVQPQGTASPSSGVESLFNNPSKQTYPNKSYFFPTQHPNNIYFQPKQHSFQLASPKTEPLYNFFLTEPQTPNNLFVPPVTTKLQESPTQVYAPAIPQSQVPLSNKPQLAVDVDSEENKQQIINFPPQFLRHKTERTEEEEEEDHEAPLAKITNYWPPSSLSEVVEETASQEENVLLQTTNDDIAVTSKLQESPTQVHAPVIPQSQIAIGTKPQLAVDVDSEENKQQIINFPPHFITHKTESTEEEEEEEEYEVPLAKITSYWPASSLSEVVEETASQLENVLPQTTTDYIAEETGESFEDVASVNNDDTDQYSVSGGNADISVTIDLRQSIGHLESEDNSKHISKKQSATVDNVDDVESISAKTNEPHSIPGTNTANLAVIDLRQSAINVNNEASDKLDKPASDEKEKDLDDVAEENDAILIQQIGEILADAVTSNDVIDIYSKADDSETSFIEDASNEEDQEEKETEGISANQNAVELSKSYSAVSDQTTPDGIARPNTQSKHTVQVSQQNEYSTYHDSAASLASAFGVSISGSPATGSTTAVNSAVGNSFFISPTHSSIATGNSAVSSSVFFNPSLGSSILTSPTVGDSIVRNSKLGSSTFGRSLFSGSAGVDSTFGSSTLGNPFYVSSPLGGLLKVEPGKVFSKRNQPSILANERVHDSKGNNIRTGATDLDAQNVFHHIKSNVAGEIADAENYKGFVFIVADQGNEVVYGF